jgi:acetoin utilization protein AcuA
MMRTLQEIDTASGAVTIIHDASLADVEAHTVDPGLTSLMHSPLVRRSVLRNLAADPRARLTLAVAGGRLIGHYAIGPSFGRWHPSFGRWQALPRVREVAFEIARGWRRLGILERLGDVALADPAVADEIVLAFLWPSAWDIEQVGLQPTRYRAMLTELGVRYGFRPVETDEPELVYGGALLVRIGERVSADARAAFEHARVLGVRPFPAAA